MVGCLEKQFDLRRRTTLIADRWERFFKSITRQYQELHASQHEDNNFNEPKWPPSIQTRLKHQHALRKRSLSRFLRPPMAHQSAGTRTHFVGAQEDFELEQYVGGPRIGGKKRS